jgi:hypothetical protein
MKRRVYFAPAGATRGAAPRPRKLLKKFDQNFLKGGVRVVKIVFFAQNLTRNAEFSTFSTIKVRKSSLQFAKVVLLYKVRNFAERFAGFFTLFVFNKI